MFLASMLCMLLQQETGACIKIIAIPFLWARYFYTLGRLAAFLVRVQATKNSKDLCWNLKFTAFFAAVTCRLCVCCCCCGSLKLICRLCIVGSVYLQQQDGKWCDCCSLNCFCCCCCSSHHLSSNVVCLALFFCFALPWLFFGVSSWSRWV